jgi:hypothetical protein
MRVPVELVSAVNQPSKYDPTTNRNLAIPRGKSRPSTSRASTIIGALQMGVRACRVVSAVNSPSKYDHQDGSAGCFKRSAQLPSCAIQDSKGLGCQLAEQVRSQRRARLGRRWSRPSNQPSKYDLARSAERDNPRSNGLGCQLAEQVRSRCTWLVFGTSSGGLGRQLAEQVRSLVKTDAGPSGIGSRPSTYRASTIASNGIPSRARLGRQLAEQVRSRVGRGHRR